MKQHKKALRLCCGKGLLRRNTKLILSAVQLLWRDGTTKQFIQQRFPSKKNITKNIKVVSKQSFRGSLGEGKNVKYQGQESETKKRRKNSVLLLGKKTIVAYTLDSPKIISYLRLILFNLTKKWVPVFLLMRRRGRVDSFFCEVQEIFT